MSEKAEDEAYCTTCGEIVKRRAEICPECGTRRKPAPQSATTSKANSSAPEKDPGVAAVLSFFYSGLGQIYNGQVGKGIVLMIAQGVNVLLMFVLIGLVTFPLVWVFGIYDAYQQAEQINERNG